MSGYDSDHQDFLTKVRGIGYALGQIEIHFNNIIENLREEDEDEAFIIDVGIAYQRGIEAAHNDEQDRILEGRAGENSTHRGLGGGDIDLGPED